MKSLPRKRAATVAAALVLVLMAGLYLFIRGHGFDARAEPGRLETAVATRLRALAIPSPARDRANPEPPGDEAFEDGLAHFADHCATCHANDGSGDTDYGRGLYPKPPDMRLAPTQSLTDGELFYLIEHGVPLTGMPGFGSGTPEGETASWRLVHFIRRIPRLTDEELGRMAELNPMSAAAWQQRQEELEFLRGGGNAPAPAPSHKHSGGSQ
ncbi:hypothetical protein BH23ACI1_BH23ACI1_30100 [soil metagenome]